MRKILSLLVLLSSVFYLHATDAVLMHSYNFSDGAKDTPGTGVTAVDGVLNGGGAISNGVYTNTSDGYISFDGSALAINTYSGITMEAYIKASSGLNGNDWVLLTNFGTGDNNLMFMSNTRGGWPGTTALASGGGKSVEIGGLPQKDDGNLHHLVQVLSNNVMKLYLDGVLLGTKTDAPSVSDIGIENAILGWPAQWGWVPKWKGAISEFNIYDGELTVEQIQANATAFLTGPNDFNSDPTDATLSGITLNAGSFRSAFASAQTTYSVLLPFGTTSVTPSVAVTTTGATFTGTGAIDVSSGSGSSTIEVTAKDGVTTKTYTINYTVAAAASIRHSYTFNDGTANDTPGTGITAVNGTLNGAASVADGKLTLSGGYASFDGAALDLNAYNGITFEYFIKPTALANSGHWNWFSYFGADWGNNCIMTGDGTWDKYRLTKNNGGDGNIEADRTDDGALHHLVGIVTGGVYKLYVDGTKVGEQATTAPYIIGSGFAYLGRAFWDDPSWQGNVGEFNIYEGELSATDVAAHASAFLNSVPADIKVKNANSTKVYANGGQIVVEAKAGDNVSVYNQVGQKTEELTLTTDKVVLNNSYSAGVYVITVNDKAFKLLVK